MSASKISVDLKQRTFSIEVPDERIDSVLDRIEALFRKHESRGGHVDIEEGSDAPSHSASNDDNGDQNSGGANGGRLKRKAKGVSKAKVYEAADLSLSATQREDLRKYFEAKSPKTQNDMVAVIGVKLSELLAKKILSPGEVISGLRVVNKPIPKNLRAVFGNMSAAGVAATREGELIVNYHTEDHVNHHMLKKMKE